MGVHHGFVPYAVGLAGGDLVFKLALKSRVV
uniref:Uncharacterized protein n=1 Tax=mine drainage metagenome TaxID=410659 RepID=E6QWK8_9ZZZZ